MQFGLSTSNFISQIHQSLIHSFDRTLPTNTDLLVFVVAAIMTLVSIIAICVALAKPHFLDQTLSTPFGDANIGVGLFKVGR